MLDQVAIIIEHPVFVHPSIEIEISFVLISFRIGHTIGHVEEKARRNVSKERESYQELQGSGEIDAVWKFCLEGDDQLFQAVQANQFDPTRYLDLAVDALFIADILLNFVSARWVLEVEPMEHWRIYDNVSDIARLYLKGHFAIDVAGSLPVQYIDCVPVSV